MKTTLTSRSCLALWGGLAIIAATASLTADTLVLLDGSKVEGKLRSCDDTDCFLEAKKIPIEKIARIELQPATSRPHARAARRRTRPITAMRLEHRSK